MRLITEWHDRSLLGKIRPNPIEKQREIDAESRIVSEIRNLKPLIKQKVFIKSEKGA